MRKLRHAAPLRALAAALAVILAVAMFPVNYLTVHAAGTTLVTDGGAVTWDFEDGNAAIYGEPHTDGSLSITGTFGLNSGGHGADIDKDTVISIAVPAGQTTLTFGVCAYGSSTADISVGDELLADDFSLNHATTDGSESSIQYTSDVPATIMVTVSGSGFLHYITAKTVTVPEYASVSGTVEDETGDSASVDGETLLFTDESENVVKAEIVDGAYSASLPIKHTYTVSFENSDVYEITGKR